MGEFPVFYVGWLIFCVAAFYGARFVRNYNEPSESDSSNITINSSTQSSNTIASTVSTSPMGVENTSNTIIPDIIPDIIPTTRRSPLFKEGNRNQIDNYLDEMPMFG